jgi:hypothetical protein
MIRDEVECEVEVGDKVIELPELGEEPTDEKEKLLDKSIATVFVQKGLRRALQASWMATSYLLEAQSFYSSVLIFLHPKRHAPKLPNNETFLTRMHWLSIFLREMFRTV